MVQTPLVSQTLPKEAPWVDPSQLLTKSFLFYSAEGVLNELTKFQPEIEQIIILLQQVDSLELSSISQNDDLVADIQDIESEFGVIQTSGTFDSAAFEQELVTYGAEIPHTTSLLHRLTSEGIFDQRGDRELEQGAQAILEWQHATGQETQGVPAGCTG